MRQIAPALILTLVLPQPAFAQETGHSLSISADRQESNEAGVLKARGHVIVTYQGMNLHADAFRFDRTTGQGEASGSVLFDQSPYHLEADRISFDLPKRTLIADQWRAIIDQQGQFKGKQLHVTPKRTWGQAVFFTPCLHEHPGYWLSAKRLDWYPQRTDWNLHGQWVQLLVSKVPILTLPFFSASVGEAAAKRRIKLPDRHIDASFGFDGDQGAFIDSQTRYQLAPGLTGTLPIRLMQNRGLSAGINQDLPMQGMRAHFDGNYTQYFPWIPVLPGTDDSGRQGAHANLALTKDWGSGIQSILSMGYRVDVGRRNDMAYQEDPGGYPVDHLPDLTTTFPSLGAGPFSLSPSLRAGYLIEERSGNSSGVFQGNVGLGLSAWHPNAFWNTAFYGNASSCYYHANRSQSVFLLGMSNSQQWTPWLGTRFGFETQPVLTTGGGTLFLYDKATGVDRILVGSNLQLFGPWTFGVNAFWARSQNDPLMLSRFLLGDFAIGVHYSVNCLSVGATFRPPLNGQPFQFTFDYHLASF